jgi:hypothetical protein
MCVKGPCESAEDCRRWQAEVPSVCIQSYWATGMQGHRTCLALCAPLLQHNCAHYRTAGQTNVSPGVRDAASPFGRNPLYVNTGARTLAVTRGGRGERHIRPLPGPPGATSAGQCRCVQGRRALAGFEACHESALTQLCEAWVVGTRKPQEGDGWARDALL